MLTHNIAFQAYSSRRCVFQFVIFFACCLPITFFWYGWSADKAVHVSLDIFASFNQLIKIAVDCPGHCLVPFGFGMMGIFIPIQTYTIDSFPTFAASGVAALTVARSLLGAFLPLAGPSMYQALGLAILYWGSLP